MGNKLKLIPFLFKTLSSDSWPSCSNQPKTLSFRAAAAAAASVEQSSSGDEDEDEKAVLSGLRAKDRLFFEPGETSSILEHEHPLSPKQRKTGVETAEMDSLDPVMDFLRSMEEMVEAHGMKDWDGLEELLGWYLSVNEKSNHGYIVGAFVDLIIGICLSEEQQQDDDDDDDEELSTESLLMSRSCSSSLLTRSDDHHKVHDNNHNHNNNSTIISISQSPTSALSFSSSSTSSCSILPSSLQALIEADDHEDKIKNTIN